MTGLPRLTSTGRAHVDQWPAERSARRVPIDPVALREQLIRYGIIRERVQSLAPFRNLAGIAVLPLDAVGRAVAAKDAAAGDFGRREMPGPGPVPEHDRRGPRSPHGQRWQA